MKQSITIMRRRRGVGQWMAAGLALLAAIALGWGGCSPPAEQTPRQPAGESSSGGSPATGPATEPAGPQPAETQSPEALQPSEQPGAEVQVPEQPAGQPAQPGKGPTAAEQPGGPEEPQIPAEQSGQAVQPEQPVEQPEPPAAGQSGQSEPGSGTTSEPPLTYPPVQVPAESIAGQEPTEGVQGGESGATVPAEQPAAPGTEAPSPSGEAVAQVQVAAALGSPLVDHPERLKRLDPQKPLWLDPDGKRVVMIGQVCQTDAPLEVFACLKGTKEHEAVVTVDIEAYKVHAALLAIGAKAGHPVQWAPDYVPATGSVIEVTVHWKDAQGKVRSARAQDWIRNVKTGRAMEHEWVFAGSRFWVDPDTGQRRYEAESGEFICVSNFSNAMLDLPIESSQANSDLLFETFSERIPPLGTPVTIVLRPKPDGSEETAESAQQKPAEEAAPPSGSPPGAEAPSAEPAPTQPPETQPPEPAKPADEQPASHAPQQD